MLEGPPGPEGVGVVVLGRSLGEYLAGVGLGKHEGAARAAQMVRARRRAGICRTCRVHYRPCTLQMRKYRA